VFSFPAYQHPSNYEPSTVITALRVDVNLRKCWGESVSRISSRYLAAKSTISPILSIIDTILMISIKLISRKCLRLKLSKEGRCDELENFFYWVTFVGRVPMEFREGQTTSWDLGECVFEWRISLLVAWSYKRRKRETSCTCISEMSNFAVCYASLVFVFSATSFFKPTTSPNLASFLQDYLDYL
jgi:hypothetical protein